MTRYSERHPSDWVFYLLVATGLLFSLVLRIAFTLNRELDWDEFQHLHAAWMVSHGYTLYKDFWENHTPLLYYLLVPLFRFFGEDVGVILIARALMSGTAIWILYLTYALARVSHDRKTSVLAVLLLSFMVIFVEATVEVRPDQPLVVLWLTSLWLSQQAFYRQKRSYFFYGGFFLGIAWMFSPKALLPYAAMSLAFLIQSYLRNPRRAFVSFLKAQGHYTLGFLIPVGACLAFFYHENVLHELITLSLLDNLSYPHIHRPSSLLKLRHISFFAVAAAGIVITLRNFRTCRIDDCKNELLLLIPCLALLTIFFFLMPAPYNQSTLLFAPILAIYGGKAFRSSLDGVGRSRHLLTTGTSRPLLARGKELLFITFILTAGLIIPSLALFKAQPFSQTNAGQLHKIRYVLKLTTPKEVIFDGASCYIFRPQAYFYGSLVTGIVWRIEQGEIQRDIIQSLKETDCKVVIYDERVARLPERVHAFIKENYLPSEVPDVYLARNPRDPKEE